MHRIHIKSRQNENRHTCVLNRLTQCFLTCVSAQHPSDVLAGSGAVQEDAAQRRGRQKGQVVSHRDQISQREVLLRLRQPGHSRAAERCTSGIWGNLFFGVVVSYKGSYGHGKPGKVMEF